MRTPRRTYIDALSATQYGAGRYVVAPVEAGDVSWPRGWPVALVADAMRKLVFEGLTVPEIHKKAGGREMRGDRFHEGVAVAISVIVHGHGMDTLAREIADTVNLAKLWASASEYDRQALKQLPQFQSGRYRLKEARDGNG